MESAKIQMSKNNHVCQSQCQFSSKALDHEIVAIPAEAKLFIEGDQRVGAFQGEFVDAKVTGQCHLF
jgi:hypothetical protein